MKRKNYDNRGNKDLQNNKRAYLVGKSVFLLFKTRSEFRSPNQYTVTNILKYCICADKIFNYVRIIYRYIRYILESKLYLFINELYLF